MADDKCVNFGSIAEDEDGSQRNSSELSSLIAPWTKCKVKDASEADLFLSLQKILRVNWPSPLLMFAAVENWYWI